jgi:putative CocE/NonD family hydrolase
MRVERDVMVPTRDQSPIAADVFRPDGDEPVPVIVCISPYGKDVHWPERFPLYDLVEHGDYMVWETPNPEWWTARGYAVVRADTRGTGKSPGRLDLLSQKDAEDFYDLIEWCGTQPWSTGKVADDEDMAGPMAHNDPADRRRAERVTLHSGDRASHLILPVIPNA